MKANQNIRTIAQPALWLGWAFFLIANAYFCFRFPNFMAASDSVHYLWMGEQFSQGHWSEWLSGHWSPLISVLLSPFLLFGIDGYFAFTILNTLLGLLLLFQIVQWLRDFDLPVWAILFAQMALIPLILAMSFLESPDLLLVCLLLVYARTLLHLTDNRSDFLKLGFLIGLVFWAKSIGLYFCIAHLSIWGFSQLIASKKNFKPLLKLLGFTTLGIILVIGMYVLPLSLKLERFTLGTSGTYNFSLIGSDRNGQQLSREELVDPKSKYTRLWAYEEPAEFVDPWSPFEDFGHYRNHLSGNVNKLYYQFWVRDGFILLLLFSFLWGFRRSLFSFSRINEAFSSRDLLVILIPLAFLIPLAYFLVIIQSRYLWGFAILVFLALTFLCFSIRSPGIRRFFFGSILILYAVNGMHEIELWMDHPEFYEHLAEAEKNIPKGLLEGKRVAILDLPKSYYLMEGQHLFIMASRI